MQNIAPGVMCLVVGLVDDWQLNGLTVEVQRRVHDPDEPEAEWYRVQSESLHAWFPEEADVHMRRCNLLPITPPADLPISADVQDVDAAQLV